VAPLPAARLFAVPPLSLLSLPLPPLLSGFTTCEVLTEASPDIIHTVWVGLCLFSLGGGRSPAGARFAPLNTLLKTGDFRQIIRYKSKPAIVVSVVN